ncbi:MAG: hypothetical protein WAN35_13760 [Terracidiphilus sp.]
MNQNSSLMPLENDLLIVELDDRLEFSVMQPAANIGVVCGNNTGNCVAQCNTNCGNCVSGCGRG